MRTKRMISVLLLGICLGTFSKFLDYKQGTLPTFFQTLDDLLDVHNFLGGFAPWIVIAVCIAIYSDTAKWAAVRVFVFFVGMVSSYYWYSYFVAGFFPKSYAMIWAGFTIASPIFAFLTWYAKGEGTLSWILSSGIVAVLINTAFAYGMFYISVTSWLNVAMLIIGIVVLYTSPKQTGKTIAMGCLFAIILDNILPFHIW